MIPLETFALAVPVIFVAYAVFGMTGFGSAMIAVPVLIQILPLQFVVPLVVLFDMVSTALVSGRNWRHVVRGELKRLLPWMLIGIGLGVSLLRNANAKWPLILLGVFVLAVCAKGLLRRAPGKTLTPLSERWAIPYGVFGGIFSALFGIGGPIYTIYLSRRLDTLEQFRASISVVILLSGVIRTLSFGATGLYTQPGILLLAGWLLPVALIGMAAGSRLRTRLPAETLKRVIFVLLIIAGVGAIYRGWLVPT